MHFDGYALNQVCRYLRILRHPDMRTLDAIDTLASRWMTLMTLLTLTALNSADGIHSMDGIDGGCWSYML